MTGWRIAVGNFTEPIIHLPWTDADQHLFPAPPPPEQRADKACKRCGQVKPMDQFARQWYRIDGTAVHRSICKPCFLEHYKRKATP